jgi:hypothetical protein
MWHSRLVMVVSQQGRLSGRAHRVRLIERFSMAVTSKLAKRFVREGKIALLPPDPRSPPPACVHRTPTITSPSGPAG